MKLNNSTAIAITFVAFGAIATISKAENPKGISPPLKSMDARRLSLRRAIAKNFQENHGGSGGGNSDSAASGKSVCNHTSPTNERRGGSANGNSDNEKSMTTSMHLSLSLGAISYVFIAVVLFLRIIVCWTTRMLPDVLSKVDSRIVRQLRKHIFLAPTRTYHHSTPSRLLGRFTFNIPTRDQSLIIFGLFICLFVPLFVDYNSEEDDPAQNALDPKILIGRVIANRAGVFATMLCPLLFLFGGRNNFLLWVTGWPLDTFNVLHKWIGWFIIILLSIHGLIYTIIGTWLHSLASAYQKPYYNWGTAGYIFGLVVCFQSMHYFRALNYEFFLYFHILCTILVILGTWYHLIKIGYMEWVYASIAVWAFDRFMRIVRLFWSGVRTKALLTLQDDANIIEIKIDFSRRWEFYPGAFVFLHFARWNRFWQSHPFTLIESPNPADKGRLVVFLKAKKGVTKQIKRYLEENGGIAESGVLIEGPYGPRLPVHRYHTVVLFAGGIGVTGPYSCAVEILKRPDVCTRVIFVWVVNDEKPLAWFRVYLDAMRNDPRFEVHVYITNPSSASSLAEYRLSDSGDDFAKVFEKGKQSEILQYRSSFKPGRPHSDKIISEATSSCNSGDIAVVVCGPGSMNDDVRSAIRKYIVDAHSRIEYFEQSFSW
ncbi:ferric/cupric reductase transmembrane component 2 [Trichomonascus vanleenenianus]|uniref:ferric reductase family protein n=1 Tax=Trichomonascus vanleenenianus TaxID=2268995 RepID=UPI003ECA1720